MHPILVTLSVPSSPPPALRLDESVMSQHNSVKPAEHKERYPYPVQRPWVIIRHTPSLQSTHDSQKVGHACTKHMITEGRETQPWGTQAASSCIASQWHNVLRKPQQRTSGCCETSRIHYSHAHNIRSVQPIHTAWINADCSTLGSDTATNTSVSTPCTTPAVRAHTTHPAPNHKCSSMVLQPVTHHRPATSLVSKSSVW
jgi:hypothetical protein